MHKLKISNTKEDDERQNNKLLKDTYESVCQFRRI